MSHKSLEIRDRRNFYLDEGTGEPIALLHCSSGSGSAWKPVIARLSEDYRALAPDLLGYGRNATWPRGAALRLDDKLAVVDAMLDLAGRPVHLVGHSYGGTVALAAAQRFAKRIAGLTLIEPVAFHLLRGADQPDGWREISALAERHIALVDDGQDAVAAEFFMAYWMGPDASQYLPEAMRNSVIRTMPKVAAEWRLMFATYDDLGRIAEIDLSTLLVCGGRTREPARRVIEILQASLPDACHLEIADAGHMSPISHPMAAADAIRRHQRVFQNQVGPARYASTTAQ
jgi:pimeloyl-ACP methyl ester carboxylesterase